MFGSKLKKKLPVIKQHFEKIKRYDTDKICFFQFAINITGERLLLRVNTKLIKLMRIR